MSMLQDDIRNNVDQLLQVTYDHTMNAARIYRTKNVILMFGDDFAHPKAEISYETMDYIISKMKTTHPDIEIKYSTMQTYFD